MANQIITIALLKEKLGSWSYVTAEYSARTTYCPTYEELTTTGKVVHDDVVEINSYSVGDGKTSYSSNQLVCNVDVSINMGKTYTYTLYANTYDATVTFKNGSTVLETKTISQSSSSIEGLYSTYYSYSTTEGSEYPSITAEISGGHAIGTAITANFISCNPSTWYEKDNTATTVTVTSYQNYNDVHWSSTALTINENSSNTATTATTSGTKSFKPSVTNENSFITVVESTVSGNVYTYSLTTTDQYNVNVKDIIFTNNDKSATLDVIANATTYTYTVYTPYSNTTVGFYNGSTLITNMTSSAYDSTKKLYYAQYNLQGSTPYTSLTAKISGGNTGDTYAVPTVTINPTSWNEKSATAITVTATCAEAYTSITWVSTSLTVNQDSSVTATTNTVNSTKYGQPTVSNSNSFITVGTATKSGNNYTYQLTTSDAYNTSVKDITFSYTGTSGNDSETLTITPNTTTTTYTLYTPYNNVTVNFYNGSTKLTGMTSSAYDSSKSLYYAQYSIQTEPYEYLYASITGGDTGTTYGTRALICNPTSWNMTITNPKDVSVTTSQPYTSVTWAGISFTIGKNSTQTATTKSESGINTNFDGAVTVQNTASYITYTLKTDGDTEKVYTFTSTNIYGADTTEIFNYDGASATLSVSSMDKPNVTFNKADGIGSNGNTYSVAFEYGGKLTFPTLTTEQSVGFDGWYYADGTKATTSDTLTSDVTLYGQGDVLKWSDGTTADKTYDTTLDATGGSVSYSFYSYKYTGLTVSACNGKVLNESSTSLGIFNGSPNATTLVNGNFNDTYTNSSKTATTSHTFTFKCDGIGSTLKLIVNQGKDYITSSFTQYTFVEWNKTDDTDIYLASTYNGIIYPISGDSLNGFTYQTRTVNVYAVGGNDYGSWGSNQKTTSAATTYSYNPSAITITVNSGDTRSYISTLTQDANSTWKSYNWDTAPISNTYDINYIQSGDSIISTTVQYLFGSWINTSDCVLSVASTYNGTMHPENDDQGYIDGFTYQTRDVYHWASGKDNTYGNWSTVQSTTIASTTYSYNPSAITITVNHSSEIQEFISNFSQSLNNTWKAYDWFNSYTSNSYQIIYQQDGDSIKTTTTQYNFVSWNKTADTNVSIDVTYSGTHTVANDDSRSGFTYQTRSKYTWASGDETYSDWSSNQTANLSATTYSYSPTSVTFSSNTAKTTTVTSSSTFTQNASLAWLIHDWVTKPSSHTYKVNYTQAADSQVSGGDQFKFINWIKTTGATISLECTYSGTKTPSSDDVISAYTYDSRPYYVWKSGVTTYGTWRGNTYTGQTSNTTVTYSPTSVTFSVNTAMTSVTKTVTVTQVIISTLEKLFDENYKPTTNTYTMTYVQNANSIVSEETQYNFGVWSNTDVVLQYNYNHTGTEYPKDDDEELTGFTYQTRTYYVYKAGNTGATAWSSMITASTTAFTTTYNPTAVTFTENTTSEDRLVDEVDVVQEVTTAWANKNWVNTPTTNGYSIFYYQDAAPIETATYTLLVSHGPLTVSSITINGESQTIIGTSSGQQAVYTYTGVNPPSFVNFTVSPSTTVVNTTNITSVTPSTLYLSDGTSQNINFTARKQVISEDLSASSGTILKNDTTTLTQISNTAITDYYLFCKSLPTGTTCSPTTGTGSVDVTFNDTISSTGNVIYYYSTDATTTGYPLGMLTCNVLESSESDGVYITVSKNTIASNVLGSTYASTIVAYMVSGGVKTYIPYTDSNFTYSGSGGGITVDNVSANSVQTYRVNPTSYNDSTSSYPYTFTITKTINGTSYSKSVTVTRSGGYYYKIPITISDTTEAYDTFHTQFTFAVKYKLNDASTVSTASQAITDGGTTYIQINFGKKLTITSINVTLSTNVYTPRSGYFGYVRKDSQTGTYVQKISASAQGTYSATDSRSVTGGPWTSSATGNDIIYYRTLESS